MPESWWSGGRRSRKELPLERVTTDPPVRMRACTVTVQHLLYQMPLQHLEAAPIVCEGCKWGIGAVWYIFQKIVPVDPLRLALQYLASRGGRALWNCGR